MLSYQTFATFPNLLSLHTVCCFINFCRLIKFSSSYQTFVIFSPFPIYSLFTISTHLINVPLNTTLSLSCLIVRTLSAPIHISNSPGVFGHSDMGRSRHGWGFSQRTSETLQISISECIFPILRPSLYFFDVGILVDSL